MKKVFSIVAVSLIALGAVIFVAAFVASGSDFSKLDTVEYETNTYPLRADFSAIEISSVAADILFQPSWDGSARVDCFERKMDRHEVFVENGTLKIIGEDKRAWYNPLAFFTFSEESVTVYLPSDRYASLSVDVGTGDVSVPDRFSFGEARIKTGTGYVSFAASADRGLKIETNTGDIGISGVNAGSIELSVSTGKIRGEDIRCLEELSVRVSTGDAELTEVACKALSSAGSTGDILLKNVLASDNFSIERSTGDVRFENCDAGRITVKTSTGDVTGTLCSEKIFLAKTSTGDTRVPDTASGGRCEITTSTGDIAIAIHKE